MKEQRTLALFRSVAVLDVALFILMGLLCLVVGWRTLDEYSTVLMWAGALIFIAGLIAIFGGGTTMGTSVIIAGIGYPTERGIHVGEYLQNLRKHLGSPLGCAGLLMVVGLVSLAVGFVLQVIAG